MSHLEEERWREKERRRGKEGWRKTEKQGGEQGKGKRV